MAVIQFKLFFPLLVSLCLLVALSQAKSTKVKYCNPGANYDVKVSGVEISPNPVQKGKPANFSISASTSETISGGKLVIDVSYFRVQIHSETHDLCGKTSCPITTGNFVVSHSQVLPGFTPSGPYSLRMKMEDENKQHQFTCITFDFRITGAPSDGVAST